MAGPGQSQGAVEGDKAHHLGLGEMPRSAPHLPEPGVGLGPDLTDQVGDLGQPAADVGIDRPAGLSVEPGGLEQVAVDVELDLGGRPVADPDGGRAPVPGEREAAFVSPDPSIQAVEHPQTRVGQLGCLHQPPEESIGLLHAPEAEQRAQHKRGIPHPAVAVVPVALTAHYLGERRRRRRRDCPRGSVDEQFQHQRAARNGIGPPTRVAQTLGPALPPLRVAASLASTSPRVGRTSGS